MQRLREAPSHTARPFDAGSSDRERALAAKMRRMELELAAARERESKGDIAKLGHAAWRARRRLRDMRTVARRERRALRARG